MRELKHYKTKDWLLFQPVVDSFKQFRNDAYSKNYCSRSPKEYEDFLAKIKLHEYTDNIIISIAFDRVEIIELLINSVTKNINNSLLIIADNSPSKTARQSIKHLCSENKIPYIGLPSNKTRHANRSHGLTLNWCYKNIIKVIEPKLFTFLDHDLIPKKPYDFANVIQNQPFYGTLWESTNTNAWQLWAGFCTFHYETVSKYTLNFLYDFSNGLDTGGRNYSPLYQHFNKDRLNFSTNDRANFNLKSQQSGNNNSIQIIDDCWIHLGGAGYIEGYEKRLAHFLHQMKQLDSIPNWSIHTSNSFTNIEPFRK